MLPEHSSRKPDLAAEPRREGERDGAPHVDVEMRFRDFVPNAFLESPIGYFEKYGRNIKEGGIEFDDSGAVKEDPTAVKDLPIWENAAGEKIYPVGKRVNLAKGKVAAANDPFYECRIMDYVRSRGLPCAQVIATASERNEYLIVMENIPGLRWSYRRILKKHGWSDEEVDEIHARGEAMMTALQKRFEAEGIIRGWKMSDMIFDIDIGAKRLNGLVPVDWERTKIRSI